MSGAEAAAAAWRLGTRGSKLALWQAEAVRQAIRDAGGPPCDITVIKTSGDLFSDPPLLRPGGKRSFVKELEEALLKHAVDLAVHSVKDMSVTLPAGLTLAAVMPREDSRDALVMRSSGPGSRELERQAAGSEAPDASSLEESFEGAIRRLGPRPRIGTASVRRVAQLSRVLPHATFRPTGGNVETRLRKLDNGEHDALILAVAGLRRLGFGGRISAIVPASACMPAPGQGAIGVESRTDRPEILACLRRISDPSAWATVAAERAVVEALGAGCQTPLGVLAIENDEGFEVQAVVVSRDLSRIVRAREIGCITEAAAVGTRVAEKLLDGGAGEILRMTNDES